MTDALNCHTLTNPTQPNSTHELAQPKTTSGAYS